MFFFNNDVSGKKRSDSQPKIPSPFHRETLTWEELLAKGNQSRAAHDYVAAIDYYQKAISKASGLDSVKCRGRAEVFIASCYRELHLPEEALKVVEDTYHGALTAMTVSLLVTIAAAYCDVADYVNALYCCDIAWRKSENKRKDRGAINQQAINSVKSRILRESKRTASDLREERRRQRDYLG